MSKPVIVFIVLYLMLQMWAPLWYYVARDDPNDERFAWRMFSSVRMLTCRAEFRTGPAQEPVPDLHGTFHEAWIELAKRGRIEVITAMAEELCERTHDEVRVELTCQTVDGKTVQRGGMWNVCELGSL